MYVKMKELGPVGGGRAPENFVCRSANASALELILNMHGPSYCEKSQALRKSLSFTQQLDRPFTPMLKQDLQPLNFSSLVESNDSNQF